MYKEFADVTAEKAVEKLEKGSEQVEQIREVTPQKFSGAVEHKFLRSAKHLTTDTTLAAERMVHCKITPIKWEKATIEGRAVLLEKAAEELRQIMRLPQNMKIEIGLTDSVPSFRLKDDILNLDEPKKLLLSKDIKPALENLYYQLHCAMAQWIADGKITQTSIPAEVINSWKEELMRNRRGQLYVNAEMEHLYDVYGHQHPHDGGISYSQLKETFFPMETASSDAANSFIKQFGKMCRTIW